MDNFLNNPLINFHSIKTLSFFAQAISSIYNNFSSLLHTLKTD